MSNEEKVAGTNVVEALFNWKENVMAQFQKIALSPNDGSIDVDVIDHKTNETENVVLEGQIHEGFLAGISVAIALLNTFPIQALTEEQVDAMVEAKETNASN